MSKEEYEFEFILPDETAPQDHLKIEELGDLSLFNPSYPYRSLGNVPDMIVKNYRSICPVCKHKMDSEPFKLGQYGVNETLKFTCPTCGTKYSLYMKGVAGTPYASSFHCPDDNNVTVEDSYIGFPHPSMSFRRVNQQTIHIGYYTLKDILENAEFDEPPGYDPKRAKLAKDPDWVRYIGEMDNKLVRNICTFAYLFTYNKKYFVLQLLITILAIASPVGCVLTLWFGHLMNTDIAAGILFLTFIGIFITWGILSDTIRYPFDMYLGHAYQLIKDYDEEAEKAKRASELRVAELCKNKGWEKSDV